MTLTSQPDQAWVAAPDGGVAMRLTSARLRRLGSGLPTGSTGTAVVDGIAIAAALAAGAAAALALDRLLVGHGPVVLPVVAALVASWTAWGLTQIRRHRVGVAAPRAEVALRTELFDRLRQLGPGYLLRQRTGQLESTLTDGVEEVGGYVAGFVPVALSTSVAVAALLLALVVVDPLVGAVAVAAVALVIGAPVLTARAFGSIGHRFAATLGATAAEYLDAIQGITTLQAFGATEAWGEHLHDQFHELAEDDTALRAMANMHLGFTWLGLAGGFAASVAVAVTQAGHHHLSPAHLLAVVTVALAALALVARLGASFPRAYRATLMGQALIDLLDAEPEAAEAVHPVRIDAAGFDGSVRFDHVTFRYAPDRAPALDQVSLAVGRGQMLAVVGPSGAGKSTLVSLLLRFFDPHAGQVSLGGHDLATLALADLRRLVAVTFQDSYLFNRTVSENLRLARADATDAEVVQAARVAHAHEFIAALPDGYHTVLGERGVRLSGGQRQRLAIARALVGDAPVLVFDEPTSSVDDASEALITEALAAIRSDRTVIVIAHRLSTVADADLVVVMDDGRVVEHGTPAQLRARGGAFADLALLQEDHR